MTGHNSGLGARDSAPGRSSGRLIVRRLGRRPYLPTWEEMRAFTDGRGPETDDELWLLEHDPVFTQGLAGRPEHVLNPGGIPVIQTDRGGQVTYHGPGQLVAYPLLDLDRLGIGIRTLVHAMEEAIIRVLAGYGLEAGRRQGAPGVFLQGSKIASIGMKVRRGCTYHGLAFNIDLDLEPFTRINPCGLTGLAMTRLADHRPEIGLAEVASHLTARLGELLNYGDVVTAAGVTGAGGHSSLTVRTGGTGG